MEEEGSGLFLYSDLVAALTSIFPPLSYVSYKTDDVKHRFLSNATSAPRRGLRHKLCITQTHRHNITANPPNHAFRVIVIEFVTYFLTSCSLHFSPVAYAKEKLLLHEIKKFRKINIILDEFIIL